MVKSLVHLALLCAAAARVVQLHDGPVDGTTENGVAMWRGIPFAAAPVGDLRWRPPQAPKPWSPMVLNATDFGADCTQALNWGLQGPTLKPGTAEDCLFVNVFAPAEQPTLPKPVLMWIYGGGYQGGGSSCFQGMGFQSGMKCDGRYDVVLARGEVLLVSFNYRVNVFGFAASEQLRGRDPDGGTGNYGILDQRFAMQWTKRNIAAFGGDPDRVLIVGQSAGGNSVANHLVRRKSWGLFSAAGVDSGAFYSWAKPMSHSRSTGPSPTNVTVTDQEPHFRALLKAAGCGDVACMLKLNDIELLKAMFAASPDQPYVWEPAIDGVDLVASGPALAAAKHLAPVPVVVGSNMEDGSQSTPNCLPNTCTEADFRRMVVSWDGFGNEDVERAAHAYGDEGERAIGEGWNKWYAAERHFGTDSMTTCPSRRLARWVTHAGQRAYWYYWAYMPKRSDGTNGPAGHGSEKPFLFHNLSMLQPSEPKIATAFAMFWIAFAINNTPGWPAYTIGTDAAIVFEEDQTINFDEHHRDLRCDFWDAHPEYWLSNSSSFLVV